MLSSPVSAVTTQPPKCENLWQFECNLSIYTFFIKKIKKHIFKLLETKFLFLKMFFLKTVKKQVFKNIFISTLTVKFFKNKISILNYYFCFKLKLNSNTIEYCNI